MRLEPDRKISRKNQQQLDSQMLHLEKYEQNEPKIKKKTADNFSEKTA